jgi:(2Fe-2S) ferredoxin
MQKHEHSFASAVSIRLLAAAIVAIAIHPAYAADTCLATPSLRADQSGHWYHRVDRVNHRRCWYLQASGAQADSTASLPATTPPSASPQPSPMSWLSSVVALVTGTGSTGAEQGVTTRDARIAQTTSEGSLTRRSRAARRVEPAGADIKRIALRDTRVVESKAASTLPSAEQTIPPAPLPSQEWSKAQERAPSLQVVEHEALFREFLHWQERQSSAFW